MMLPKKMHTVDEFGVLNYSGRFLAIIGIGALYGLIALFAFLLLYFEKDAPGSNISNYADAFWTLQMSASTIGFGDHFPVSLGGPYCCRYYVLYWYWPGWLYRRTHRRENFRLCQYQRQKP